MDFQIGKLYVSSHTERRDNVDHKFELILFCTGSGVKPKWGNYKTLSGVVIKNTDTFSDHRIGNFSETWNAGQFSEYNEPITIDNANWVEQKEIGCCPG